MNNDRKYVTLLHVAIIATAGIMAYLCCMAADFLGLDDVDLVQGLGSTDFSFHRLLFSGAGEYFRPLPFITYLADARLFGGGAAWFHGVNLAIHLLNGILVYFLMLHMGKESKRHTYPALTAALIFTLHPLNTEAVMWVSARPDLLCCFFSLLSLILICQIKESPRFLSLCCLFLAFLFSLFSKEASITLPLVVPLYLLCESGKQEWKKVVLISAPFFAVTVLWLFLRGGNKAVLDRGIRKVVTTVVASNQDHSKFLDMVAAYGFYLKKLIYPFPLNFAIVDFNKTVAFMVLALSAVAALFLVVRDRLSRLPILLIFTGIVPPVAAYVAKLAWTPYAERYLYLPMVGFSLLLAMLVYNIPNMPRILPVGLAILLAIPTIYRVSLWADPVAFWNDIVVKSPRFSRSYVCLATALSNVHDYDAAERNLDKAQAMGYDQVPLWENLAAVYYAKRDYPRYEAAMVKLTAISPDPTGVYIKLIGNMTRIPERQMDRRTAYGKAIGYYSKILEKNPSFYLSYYNIGKLYWVMGEHEHAARYLELFLTKTKNDPMQPFARKILDRIAAATGSSG